MTYLEYSRIFHNNAVKHGWWEKEREKGEIFALIHSEWSEALEEYRNGMPHRYFGTKDNIHDEPTNEFKKPEGISVELADGVIRILDYMAHALDVPDTDITYAPCTLPLPVLVCELHAASSDAYRENDPEKESEALINIVKTVFGFISASGHDPIYIMYEKHRYNETRSYRHGAKKA